MTLADLLAAQYGWSRREIWWEVPFGEALLYADAIIHRKAAENGTTRDLPSMTDDLVHLYEVIEAVKAEKRAQRR